MSLKNIEQFKTKRMAIINCVYNAINTNAKGFFNTMLTFHRDNFILAFKSKAK